MFRVNSESELNARRMERRSRLCRIWAFRSVLRSARPTLGGERYSERHADFMKLVTSPFGGGLSSTFNASILNQFYTANWYVDIYFRSSSPLPIQKNSTFPRNESNSGCNGHHPSFEFVFFPGRLDVMVSHFCGNGQIRLSTNGRALERPEIH
jgi:hypothetical protein